MKFKVLKEFENPLLKRVEYEIEIDDVKATPKRIDVLKQLSAKMGFDPKLVIVDTIYTRADTSVVVAYVKVYNDEKTLEAVELKKQKERRKKILDVLYPKEVKQGDDNGKQKGEEKDSKS